MNFSLSHRLLAAAALLLIMAVPAAAQRIDSPYRFVEFGQSLGPVLSPASLAVGALDQTPRSGTAFGARYGLRFGGGPFTGEATLALLPTTRQVLDTVRVDDEFAVLGEADVTLAMVLGGLRFNITGPRTFHGVQPYVVFGAGIVRDMAGRSAADAELEPEAQYRFGTKIAGQFGGGAEWFASDRLAVRLDARNVLWRLTTPTAFRLAAGADQIPADEWRSNHVLTVGLGWYF